MATVHDADTWEPVRAAHKPFLHAYPNDTIFRNMGMDTIAGDDGRDLLYGMAGSDTITGGGKPDTIYGGDGNDLIDGGAGNNLLFGETGNDLFLGRANPLFHNLLDGGPGHDYAHPNPADLLMSLETIYNLPHP